MDFKFLSEKYYDEYTNDMYPQLELKPTRPYAHVKINMYGYDFYIPLRSNIMHPHAFFTDKKNKCGVDYSKAVIITDESYVDCTKKVFLRNNEFKRLKGKEYKIKKGFEEYIKLYQSAKNGEEVPHKEDILLYSSLQYFENYLFSKQVPEQNVKELAQESELSQEQ